ncbi:MAG: hypothetical protein ABIO70_01195 [Pseudomonadota bacterium]
MLAALALPLLLGACSLGFRRLDDAPRPAPGDSDSAPVDSGGDSGADTSRPHDSGTPTETGDPPSDGRAPLDPDRPGGWASSTLVFAQAKMLEDASNDDWVALGWIELDEGAVGTACGNSGPRARRTFQKWADDEDYPEGDCDEDRKDGVDFARWDHTDVYVDECPGLGAWAEADGSASSRTFLDDCPAHVTAGFGKDEERITWEGWYAYNPEARTLTFKYEVHGDCKKEYYRDLTHDADGRLLAMRLDGERTGDMTSSSRGLGATHGYAYGSAAAITVVPSFAESRAAVAGGSLRADAWRFREVRDDGAPLEHYQEEAELGFTPVSCGVSVGYDHSCEHTSEHDPYLLECAEEASPATAYLRFLVDPFPDRDTREHLYWAWHAHHASAWQGCYHRGSHSNPTLQVVDSEGAFRGYVGVEIQRSSQTDGGGGAPDDAWLQTDYRAFRWIEAGFEEMAG